MKARHNKIGNDLFWEILDFETNKFIKWCGYDDDYWWNNVATSKEWCKHGKYILNPFTSEVSKINEDNFYEGEGISIEEMPQGCVISQNGNAVTVAYELDTKKLIESLKKMLVVMGADKNG